MHPGLGPQAEAELLYVRQLKIPERMRAGEDALPDKAITVAGGVESFPAQIPSPQPSPRSGGESQQKKLRNGGGEFVVWDVGLGAAANAIAVLRATRDIARPLRLASFDNTDGPLEFGLTRAKQLGYFHGYKETTKAVLENRGVRFTDGAHEVDWQFYLGDFPAWLANVGAGVPPAHSPTTTALPHGGDRRDARPALSAPHAILFDAFSPAKNPAMWTLPLFTDLFRALDPARPCNLTTYSRSTMFRVTLLLAGFFVGRGVPMGLKEETTVAANTPKLIEQPLDRRWLERARRSDSAEPLHQSTYVQSPLKVETREKLRSHPQFYS